MRAGAGARCPVCEGTLRPHVETPRLAVAACTECGHAVAEHAASRANGADYHRQYDDGAFLDALRATRVRQASRILGSIRRVAPAARSLLDFGCGRGWFLDAASRAGFGPLAGADGSALAIELLRDRGVDAVQVTDGGSAEALAGALEFTPQVMTLLDVVEHFPAAAAVERLTALVRALRPELVVVKVPVRNGLLYRSAVALARVGAPAAIEQLYQVGTDPPHRAYFSRRSLERFLTRVGLRPLEVFGDRDFEPEHLAARARALAGAPRLARGAGALAAAAAACGLEDAAVAIARYA